MLGLGITTVKSSAQNVAKAIRRNERALQSTTTASKKRTSPTEAIQIEPTITPAPKVSRTIDKTSPSATQPSSTKMVQEYEVGLYDTLKARPRPKGIEIHHAPQKHPAKQSVQGYDEGNAPSIALTRKEHKRITNLRGTYNGTDRQLLVKSVKDLRNNTNAPQKNVKELLDLAKKTNPDAYKK